MNVIMGASGAGKTTLLNILACRIDIAKDHVKPGTASGYTRANDLEYSKNSFGNFAGYVMQNDILLSTMTVRETLEYIASLRMR